MLPSIYSNSIVLQPHKCKHKLNHLTSLNPKKLNLHHNPNHRFKCNLRLNHNPNPKLFLKSKLHYCISQLIKAILSHLKAKIFTINLKPLINMSSHKLPINMEILKPHKWEYPKVNMVNLILMASQTLISNHINSLIKVNITSNSSISKFLLKPMVDNLMEVNHIINLTPLSKTPISSQNPQL